MTVPQSRLLIAICAAALLLTSCETSNQKRASSAPPPQATAPALATVPAAAQPQAQPQPAPPLADPVDSLITQAEGLYQNGEAYYRVGQPEAGKQNFDDALNLLRSSPIDIRGNDRLHEKLSALGIPHTCDLTTRAGGHTWGYFNAMAGRALRFCHAGLEQESRRLL